VLLDIRVAEVDDLRQEVVQPHVRPDILPEHLQLGDPRVVLTIHGRLHGPSEALLRRPDRTRQGVVPQALHQDRRDRVDLLVGVDPGHVELVLQVMDEVRTRAGGDGRFLVVRLNAPRMSSALFAKSSTIVELPGTYRFSLDNVCTAATPSRRLSTYIAHSLFWSNPVWNMLATIITRYSGLSNAVRAIASPRSCRTRLRHGDPNTDSPRIPHDKVTKMTDSCHKTLSEGHHHPPAERFKSSLGHVRIVALTRVNSQSHCRSRNPAQHMHNISWRWLRPGGLVWAEGCTQGTAGSRPSRPRLVPPPVEPVEATNRWSSASRLQLFESWAPSALPDAPIGDLDQAVDGRHQGGQIPLVDSALGEPCGEDFEQLDPSVDVAWFGPRHRNFDALLNDTNGPLTRRVIGLPTPVPARR